jgi:hypothetical protein
MKTEAVLKKNLLSIIGGGILVSGLIVAVVSEFLAVEYQEF